MFSQDFGRSRVINPETLNGSLQSLGGVYWLWPICRWVHHECRVLVYDPCFCAQIGYSGNGCDSPGVIDRNSYRTGFEKIIEANAIPNISATGFK